MEQFMTECIGKSFFCYNYCMTDEAQTPPADTQTPTEPTPAPSSETAQPEIAPAAEASQTESAQEVPSGAVEAPRASENSEAVTDTIPEPQTAQTIPTQSAPTVTHPHGDLVAANAKIQSTKRKRMDKIMARLSEKGRITNDEVEKLLRVSDATATRYLETLEKENRIKQTGKTGTGVFYEKP